MSTQIDQNHDQCMQSNIQASPALDINVAGVVPVVPLALSSMTVYAQENPPVEGWILKNEKCVYVASHVRFRIFIEEAQDIGYGLSRHDQLAKHGIFASDFDSRLFAADLLEVIQDKLCIADLENLKNVFMQAYLKAENERQQHMEFSTDKG